MRLWAVNDSILKYDNIIMRVVIRKIKYIPSDSKSQRDTTIITL